MSGTGWLGRRAACCCLGVVAAFLTPAICAQIPEQYPKPLIHTATNHPAQHILLVSVDGLHAFDLANYIAAHPRSTLAALSAHGVTYSNAHAPWADPTSSFVSLATGGTPISTGIVATHTWDHSLSPAGSACKVKGALLSFDAQYAKAQAPLDSAHGCLPVEPHSLLRVNTIFEVVHNKIGPTAWAGESEATTDLLRGPSNLGLDDAQVFRPLAPGVAAAQAADQMRLDDVLGRMTGKDSPVPVLFGLSITSLAAAQSDSAAGYVDASGTPSAGLTKSLDWLDAALARIVQIAHANKLADSAWLVLTAPYGQSRIDSAQRRIVTPAQIAAAIQPAAAARISGGDIATIWLDSSADSAAAVKALALHASALGIADVLSGERLALTFNRAADDPRAPDIIVQPAPNVVYAADPSAATVAAHGGLSDWNTHVALLISGAQLTGRTDPTWVPTTQLAPLLLRALGMEKFDLDALHREHTPALPGIF